MVRWLEANLDYVVYGSGCIVVFYLLDRWLHRRTPSARLPVLAWAGMAAVLVVGWFFVESAGNAERHRIRSFLQGVAPTYAQEIERAGHAGIQLNTSSDNPNYLAILRMQRRWKQANPMVSDIFTYRKIADRVVLIADADEAVSGGLADAQGHPRRISIGTEYPQADAAMLQALNGVPSFSANPVRDLWGLWVSANVPLRDANGKVEAALGVTYPADDWVRAIAHGRQRMEWFLAIPVLILGFSSALGGVQGAELASRQKLAAAVRESEARLRTSLDHLPLAFWMMDANGKYSLLNAVSRNIWGDITGRTLEDIDIEPALRARWAEDNRRAFAGEEIRGEMAIAVGEEQRVFHSVVAPVRVDGDVIGILGASVDITDRVHAEEALRKSEEKLALHVRHTPLAVIEWDLRFRVTAWNTSAERIFGYTAAEAIGQAAPGWIVPENARDQIDRVWAALVTHSGGTRSTNENLTKSGRVILCEWYNTALVDDSGKVIGVASSVQDITERDLLEKQLYQSQKMESVGQLAGGVAHEFNNLLTPMLVQSDMIALHYSSDARLLGLLRPIQDAIQQAAQLNRRILTIGRRNAEKRELLSLNALVENALALLRPSLDLRIELGVTLAAGLEALSLDRSHVAQIVMNLALNARDTLLEKLAQGPRPGWAPRLTITTERVRAASPREGASAMPFRVTVQVLTVTDNGLGIPAEVRPRIFEPFYTTKETGRGTGLGLAVVWNVVHGLGGWIDVDAAPGGEGTRFQVCLPVPAVPSALADAPAPLAPRVRGLNLNSAKKLRILLAEDNALVAETFTALLGAAGHEILVSQDGQEAWELFNRRNAQFDVVLADYNMPRMDGAELLRLIKATGFAGRVMVLSGYLTAERVDELERAGADAVLRKPFSPADLLAALNAPHVTSNLPASPA